MPGTLSIKSVAFLIKTKGKVEEKNLPSLCLSLSPISPSTSSVLPGTHQYHGDVRVRGVSIIPPELRAQPGLHAGRLVDPRHAHRPDVAGLPPGAVEPLQEGQRHDHGLQRFWRTDWEVSSLRR